MTRAQLRQRVTTAEFTEWVAFYLLESEAAEQQAQEAKRKR
jgi:hypothetical protein